MVIAVAPANWPLLRDALMAMGRADLIGNGKHHLVPRYQPGGESVPAYHSPRKKNSSVEQGVSYKTTLRKGRVLTQHTGLPPRAGVKSLTKPGKPQR